jgi:hypothetical protein
MGTMRLHLAIGLTGIALGAAPAAAQRPPPPRPPVSALAEPLPLPPPPGPPRRKPPAEQSPAAAIAPFVQAILADKAGDLDLAQRRYEESAKIFDQPAARYNLADVRRRMEKWQQAVAGYREYLALAPAASDRGEVERLIRDIEARPGLAVIDGDEPDAIVYVNGRLVGPSPVVVALPPGRHHADRVTRDGHAQRSFTVRPATTERVRASVGGRPSGGNVILTGASRTHGSWRDGDVEYRFPARQLLRPGRHRTQLLGPGRACSALEIDAPPPGQLVLVYVEVSEVSDGGCSPIQVTQQRVRLAP